MIELSHDGAVAVLTMAHAPHNLMDAEFIEAYCSAQEEAVVSGARAILVRSSLRHFSAGANVGSLGSDTTDAAATLGRLGAIGLPTVAAVNGAAVGGGFELALACDLIVAAQSAQLGAVEVHVGLAPLLGGVQRLVARAGPARANEMAMLGRRYSADVLERWGIVNLVVADEELGDASMSLAKQLAAGPTVAIAAIKRLVAQHVNNGLQAADEALTDELAPIWSSGDVTRGMEAMRSTGPGTAVFEGK